MAASAFIKECPPDIKLIAPPENILDVTDKTRIQDVFDKYQPRVVIHLAALTDVDYCEEHPSEALLVNAKGTLNVGQVCKQNNAFMVYLSTGSIFNGESKEPYFEDAKPAPVNIYGHSKYQGELCLRTVFRNSPYLIVRSCWFFGGDEKDKKFVQQIKEKLEKKLPIYAAKDLRGTPTYTRDLAKAVYYMLSRSLDGVYHFANQGVVSRSEMVQVIADNLRVSRYELIPVNSYDLNLLAPRPSLEALNCRKLEKTGFDNRPWTDALKEYLGNCQFSQNKT